MSVKKQDTALCRTGLACGQQEYDGRPGVALLKDLLHAILEGQLQELQRSHASVNVAAQATSASCHKTEHSCASSMQEACSGILHARLLR